jgi:AhpD family alkylhydroperoxidase
MRRDNNQLAASARKLIMADTTPRIAWSEYEHVAPETVAALRALGKAIDDSGLEKPLTELLKVRASQLNGCAYCLHFHLVSARKVDVAAAKLDLVATWRDVGVFTARERAALAWTESLTLMAQYPVSDAIYAERREHFSTSEIVFLTATVSLINAWNRVAGGLRFFPAI